MSDESSVERRARAAHDAAAWMVRLQTDHPNTAEREQFVDWLRESPLHVAEMLRVGIVHDRLVEFDKWSAMETAEAKTSDVVVPLRVHEKLLQRSLPGRHPLSLKRIALVAASFAVALVAAMVLFQNTDTAIRTRPGERRELKLVDGSLLEIAPDSALRLHMGRSERLVMLDRGEALFHVAKDSKRPFIVDAGRASVRAVGTAFSVDRTAGSVVVTVAEGTVSVTVANGQPVSAIRAASMPSISVSANQQVAIAASGAPSTVRRVKSQTEFAWARGLLIFDHNTVAEVVRRFNLGNRAQIHVLDSTLAARTVSGVFDASDPQSFVAFLKNVAGAQTVDNGGEDVVIDGPSAQTLSTTAVEIRAVTK